MNMMKRLIALLRIKHLFFFCLIRTDKIPTMPIANNKTDTISAIGTVAIFIALSTLNCSMKNLMIEEIVKYAKKGMPLYFLPSFV